MSYVFIHDMDQIARFQKLVYEKTLCDNNVHQICLSARKKYGANIHSSAYHFGHLMINQIYNPNQSDSRNQMCDANHNLSSCELGRYIQRYEVPMGAYLDDDKQPMPNNCLSIYSTLNPRDGCQVIENMYNSYFQELKAASKSGLAVKFNLKNILKSEVSKCVAKNKDIPFYLQVDIDTKNTETVNKVIEWCQQRKMVVHFSTETRGGYHIVFDRRLVPNSEQKNLKIHIPDVEMLGAEQLLTVAGTYQGGFPVRFADWLTDRCNETHVDTK
jgi:hypothetical protein